MTTKPRPPRTLGIAIAIIASALAYGCLPLTQVGFILLVQQRLANATMSANIGEEDVTPIAVGGDFLGVEPSNLVAQAVIGTVFMLIAVLAWRGRPPWIRVLFTLAVLLLTLLTFVVTSIPLLQQVRLETGIDSAEGARRTLLILRLAGSALVAMYVTWYLNRAPARAFYRGYYLDS